MGPNIYGFYYTWKNLCATFCTAYDVKGHAALSSQSGGIGMAIIGFSRSAKMGVSAIVGLGNKSDIDEDDLLTFFEQDDNTHIIAQHCEDLKDGRAFAEVAKRVSKKKPVVVLKAGRTSMGARAASSHTGALAGNDKIYDDVFKQSGVIRAKALRELLEYARAIPVLPTPKGENVVIITGAGGSGVLLSDACVDNGLKLMAMPPDLDAAFRKFIPPFGAAGNPVDITGGEPPKTYQNTIRLGLEDPRIHSLILGYWHTIITPPMVFAKLVSEVVEEFKAKGITKPIVASLAGDVEVEEAAEYLFDHGIPAYPYSTEMPVMVLGAKYKWARGAGLVKYAGKNALVLKKAGRSESPHHQQIVKSLRRMSWLVSSCRRALVAAVVAAGAWFTFVRGVRRVGADQAGRVRRPRRHRRRRRPDGALHPGRGRQEQPDEAAAGRRQQVGRRRRGGLSRGQGRQGRSAQDHHHAVQPVHHAARHRRAVQLEGPDAGRDARARRVRAVGERGVERTRPPATTSTRSRAATTASSRWPAPAPSRKTRSSRSRSRRWSARR